jgi:hypothetical protein
MIKKILLTFIILILLSVSTEAQVVLPDTYCTNKVLQCAYTYNYGDVITLTPVAGNGYVFYGWVSNVCLGMSSCTVIITADTMIEAQFREIPRRYHKGKRGINRVCIELTGDMF